MKPRDFHYRHFLPEVILQCLRWYLRYPISYRNLEEMMIERGIDVYHTTLYRWVQAYSVELAKRIRYYSKPHSTSWRVDETYIKVKGKWKYLYRAVDKYGSTIDFMLSSHRDIVAAKKFFKQVMINSALKPKLITTDKLSSYNNAIVQLKAQKILPNLLLHRQCKYLNNIIESGS